MVLCHGPIDKITQVQVDKRVAYTGSIEDESILINAPGLFGGEDREGGVSGTIDFEFGGPAQLQNSYLQSKLGTDIPGFRGVVSAILRQVYVGLNPYLKPWAFRAQRIHVSTNGEAQWNDNYSEIGTTSQTLTPATTPWDYQILGYVVDTTTPEAVEAITIPDDGYSKGTAPFGREGTGGSLDPVYPIQTFWGYNTSLWLKKIIRTPDDKNVTITGYVENGALFYWDGILFDSVNLDNTQSATPSGIPYSATVPASMVTSEYHILHILVLDEPGSNSNPVADDNTYFYGEITAGSVTGTEGDMNPAHIIRECLTDTVWGMGYLASDIDDTSFKSAALTLFNEGMGISLLWDRQIPIEDFVMEIVRHINAALYVDRVSGKFVLKLIRSDYIEDDLLLLDESNITRISDYSRVDQGDAINSVTVVYWDKSTGENASVTADDIALIQTFGTVVNTTIQYPGFTSAYIAGIAAQRDLKTLSTPLLSCTIEANREAASLNIGDTFKLVWPDYHDGYIVMRVHQIALGDGKKNRVKITASEDIFFTPSISITTPEEPGWVEPGGAPVVPPSQAVYEAPYFELAQALGQTNLDTQIAQIPEIGYMQAAAVRPTNGLTAQVWADDGSGYEQVALLDFCPSAELGGNVSRVDTSWTFTNGQDLESISVGTYALIDDEFFSIEAIDIDLGTMTVGRAVMDSVPSIHNAGAVILFLDEYAVASTTEYVDGEIIDVKILTNSSQGTLPLVDGVEDSFTFDSRAIRPYPPGNFKVNSEYFPDSIPATSNLALTWSHRDRLQQTGATFIDFFDTDVGPEANTEYLVNIYAEDDVLLNTETLSGTSKTYLVDTEKTDFDTLNLGRTGVYESSGDSTPPTTQLVALYKCDENTGGVLIDDSGNGNDGTIQGGSIVAGAIDNALQFNGSTSQGASTTHFANLSGGWCISLWLNVTWRNSQYDCIFMQDGGSQRLRFFNYSTTTQNQGLLLNYDGTSLNNIPGVRPSGLTHVLAQYNSTTGLLELYFDNVLIDSATVSTGLSTPNLTALIGKVPSNYSGNANRTVVGWVDHIRLYNRALTSSERAILASEDSLVSSAVENRLSSFLRVQLSSTRDTYASRNQHDILVDRSGYGYNYGKYYGGE